MSTLLLSGIVAGFVYALLACAIVFVYRANRVVNLAQGDIGMLSAFVFFTLSVAGSLPVLAGVAAALATGGLLGWLMNRIVIGPLGQRDPGTGLVVTLAAATILQLAALELWGSAAQHFPAWIGDWSGFRLAGLVLRGPELLALTVSLVFVAAGTVLYRRSRLGLQLRAVAESRQAATMLGVNARRVSGCAWLLGGVMSAAAAMLIAPLTRFDPHFMFAVMTSALVAALLAGFDSFAVAVIAAVLIGVLKSFAGFYSGLAGIEDVLLLFVAIALLLARPPAALRTAT